MVICKPRCWLGVLLSSLAVLSLPGCSTVAFYHQAVHGHTQILFGRTPIRKVIDDPKTDPKLAAKLALVLRLRDFAQSQLALPAGKHYLHYADVQRPFVVWDIYAAPAYSLEAKTWWYPVVGSLSYRGFFKESKARQEAAHLEARGYDVYVGGVDAYSTLGWFSDPVLNTFIDRDETDLADLIFHELAHQKLFLKGDTDFNEAFATSVAREGVRRWLTQQGDLERLRVWEEKTRRADQFMALILKARQALERAYQAAPGLALQDDAASQAGACEAALDMKQRKDGILGQLKTDYQALQRQWGKSNEFEGWFVGPVNNARLNAEATYYELLPGFARLLAEAGPDLEPFYEKVKKLGKLPKTERSERVRQGPMP